MHASTTSYFCDLGILECLRLRLRLPPLFSYTTFTFYKGEETNEENGKCPVRSIPLLAAAITAWIHFPQRGSPFRVTSLSSPPSLTLSHKATHNWGWGPQSGPPKFVLSATKYTFDLGLASFSWGIFHKKGIRSLNMMLTQRSSSSQFTLRK